MQLLQDVFSNIAHNQWFFLTTILFFRLSPHSPSQKSPGICYAVPSDCRTNAVPEGTVVHLCPIKYLHVPVLPVLESQRSPEAILKAKR